MLTSTLALLFAMSGPDLTKQHEGLRLVAYADTRGIETIGYGHRLRAGEATTMTIDDAERTFQRDYQTACRAADIVARAHHIEPPAMVGIVLVDMAYNLGGHGLARFHWMLLALARSDYNGAADELLRSHYAEQCPTRAHELARLLRSCAVPP